MERELDHPDELIDASLVGQASRALRYRHATLRPPSVQSYEPGEDWWWCFPEELFFMVAGAPPAPSHP